MTQDVPRGRRFPAQWSSVTPATTGLLRPQRLLHLAAADAAKHVVPTGLGLDSGPMRERMVERMRRDGIRSAAVLAAFAAVPRHRFVDSALAIQAYEDTSLPIGACQTISKPSVVARMLQWLFDGTNASLRQDFGRVLEIGTGCGYQTAVLARLSKCVISVERLRALHEMARRNLDASGVAHVRLVHGDGRLGHSPNAPYDSIIAAASGEDIPDAWLTQLAPGGRLVAPSLLPGAAGHALVIIDRTASGYVRQIGESVTFVPLKSGLG